MKRPIYALTYGPGAHTQKGHKSFEKSVARGGSKESTCLPAMNLLPESLAVAYKL